MIYTAGIAALGLAYAWTSGDWPKLALVPVACLTFGPWMSD
jgi:hypothetical protein